MPKYNRLTDSVPWNTVGLFFVYSDADFAHPSSISAHRIFKQKNAAPDWKLRVHTVYSIVLILLHKARLCNRAYWVCFLLQ